MKLKPAESYWLSEACDQTHEVPLKEEDSEDKPCLGEILRKSVCSIWLDPHPAHLL